jgi:hypothetical protein
MLLPHLQTSATGSGVPGKPHLGSTHFKLRISHSYHRYNNSQFVEEYFENIALLLLRISMRTS